MRPQVILRACCWVSYQFLFVYLFMILGLLIIEVSNLFVCLYLFCTVQLCCVVVWACISMNAWHKKGRKEICLFNADGTACRLGSGLAFVGFLAAMGFLALEAVFSSISSIKVRRRLVAADIGFSALWAGLFFIEFWYLTIAWNKSDYPPMGKGINNCRAAIVFSLFNIATWVSSKQNKKNVSF